MNPIRRFIMKRVLKTLLFALLLALAASVVSGCADRDIIVVSVQRCYVNDEKHVIVELSNGTVQDLGFVGEEGDPDRLSVTDSYVDERKHLMVRYSDGALADLGYVGVADTVETVSISRTFLDESLHMIVEYSDGSREDLGYVGVEVTKAEYTVKFWSDASRSKLLSTVVVTEGETPTAPTAPTVNGKDFTGWSADLGSISADTDVWPLYTDKAVYTVRFLDYDGKVLKTQKVTDGNAATAPASPTREDYIFTGWTPAFNKIKADTDVKAQYRAAKTFTVTFNDYTGLKLGSVQVKEGKDATAPVTPSREGYRFTGWSGQLTNITADKTVTAQYSFNGGTNVLDVAWKLGADGTVTATLAMNGTVSFLGMDAELTVPSSLVLVSKTDGTDVLSNDAGNGKIKIIFSSSTGRNVTQPRTLLTLTFRPVSGTSSATLGINVEDFYDEAALASASSGFPKPAIIGKTVKLS